MVKLCYVLTLQDDWLVTFYLHDAVYLLTLARNDAVYLYLRTVNSTLAAGCCNYSNGRIIYSSIIGQRFTGLFPAAAIQCFTRGFPAYKYDETIMHVHYFAPGLSLFSRTAFTDYCPDRFF